MALEGCRHVAAMSPRGVCLGGNLREQVGILSDRIPELAWSRFLDIGH